MSEFLREFDGQLIRRTDLVLAAGVGMMLLALTTLLARRWQMHRGEHSWLNRRLSVPRRLDAIELSSRPSWLSERRRFPRRVGNTVAVEIYSANEAHRLGEGR